MIALFILAVLGFGISVYAYVIEKKIKYDPSYKPVCDLSDIVSCSKPIKSPYANLFYVSNAFVGVVFYSAVMILTWLQTYTLLLLAAGIACVFSAFLAYILYFKIKSLCLVCTALYIINVAILLMVLIK